MSTLNPLIAYDDDPTTDAVHHPYSAYNQGWDAGERGHPRSCNPYPEGSTERRFWFDGWDGEDDYERELDGEPPGPTMEELGAWEMQRQWEREGYY